MTDSIIFLSHALEKCRAFTEDILAKNVRSLGKILRVLKDLAHQFKSKNMFNLKCNISAKLMRSIGLIHKANMSLSVNSAPPYQGHFFFSEKGITILYTV